MLSVCEIQGLMARVADHCALVIETMERQTWNMSACVRALRECLHHRGGKIMVCGNGGSAADAQHFAAELSGRFVKARGPLAGLALTTDTSAITAIANDFGYEQVFARQVTALGNEGDVLVCISTSGSSASILEAAAQARAMGIAVIGLIGGDGGQLHELCDYQVIVHSFVTARVQEVHQFVYHTWCEGIEE
jgi:D-sedoheptulose 7-phosphate isomerase